MSEDDGRAATVEQEIVIDAPVEVVWRTLTEPEHIACWFTDVVDLEATPGYDGSLTFTAPDAASSMTVQVSVQSVEPSRSFSYRWMHPAGTPARAGNSLLVTFTLVPAGTGTRLRVVETGLQEMGWSRSEQDDQAADHTAGWVRCLARLRDRVDHVAAQRARP